MGRHRLATPHEGEGGGEVRTWNAARRLDVHLPNLLLADFLVENLNRFDRVHSLAFIVISYLPRHPDQTAELLLGQIACV